MKLKNLFKRRRARAADDPLLLPPPTPRVSAETAPPPPKRRDPTSDASKTAAKDDAFRDLVGRADAFRDERRWEEARACYAEALQRHPLHGGYWVQLGHMLKELDRGAEAEIAYRNAFALGQTDDDTREHLMFVARRNGVQDFAVLDKIRMYWARGETGRPLDAPPCDEDIRILTRFMCGPRQPDERALRDLMVNCASLDEVCATIASSDDFRAVNRSLLRMIHETKAATSQGRDS